MAFKDYIEPTEPLFKDFKILDFDKYRELHVAKFMWKLSKNEIPISISKLFNKQTSRNVLNLQLLVLQTFSLSYGVHLKKNIYDTILPIAKSEKYKH